MFLTEKVRHLKEENISFLLRRTDILSSGMMG
jgi:hypothetical protein